MVKTLLDELACGSKRLRVIIESNLCNKDRSTPLFSHGHLGKLVFTNCSNRNLIPVQQLPLCPIGEYRNISIFIQRSRNTASPVGRSNDSANHVAGLA